MSGDSKRKLRSFHRSKSGFRGVSYDAQRKVWRAEGGNRRNGSRWRGPWRISADSAARDYDDEARKRYGASACLNFLGENEVHARGHLSGSIDEGRTSVRREGGITWNEQQAREAEAIDAVFAAAWARGWTLVQIAFAASVSSMCVQLRIARYEAKHGRIERNRRPPKNFNTAKHSWRCKVCGKVQWFNRKRLRDSPLACSPTCHADLIADYSARYTEISDDMNRARNRSSSARTKLGVDRARAGVSDTVDPSPHLEASLPHWNVDGRGCRVNLAAPG